MANNFKVWVDSPGSVIMSAEDFASDSQRSGGFVAGTAASVLRVNSALRQANLVITALMGLVDDSNLDLKSSVSDVQNAIRTYLSGLTVNKATNADITSDLTVADNVIKFAIGNGTAYNKTITPLNSYDNSKGTVEDRLTNSVTLNTAQNITGTKTFNTINATTLNVTTINITT